jgi:hypothetical protein
MMPWELTWYPFSMAHRRIVPVVESLPAPDFFAGAAAVPLVLRPAAM